MTRETVAAQKECAFIDRGGCYGVNASGCTELDCSLNVFGSGFAGEHGFNGRFDGGGDVGEMEDDWIGEVFWKRFVATDDVIPGLQVQRTRCMSQQLRIAYDYRQTNAAHFCFGYSFQNHFRSDSGGVAHCDADTRQRATPVVR